MAQKTGPSQRVTAEKKSFVEARIIWRSICAKAKYTKQVSQKMYAEFLKKNCFMAYPFPQPTSV
jgi:hypothetical protein